MRFLVLVVCWLMHGCTTVTAPQSEFNDKGYAQEKKNGERRAEAESLYQSGEYDEAEVILKELLQANEDDLFANYRMGNISFGRGGMDKAATFFERVVKTDSKNAKAHYNLAVIYLIQAQRGLQNYAATSPADTDLKGVMKVLRDIESFAKTNALHSLVKKKPAAMGAIKRSDNAQIESVE